MIKSENLFETGARKVVPAVLVYLRKDHHFLMIHRNSKGSENSDYHEGKWNGLGGKCEVDESPLQAAQREVQEESGLELALESFQGLGVLQFPNFKPHLSQDWIVFVFTAHLDSGVLGEPQKKSVEGDLHWIPVQDILKLNLWPGDLHFIPYVLQSKPFIGTLWYENKEVLKHWIQTL